MFEGPIVSYNACEGEHITSIKENVWKKSTLLFLILRITSKKISERNLFSYSFKCKHTVTVWFFFLINNCPTVRNGAKKSQSEEHDQHGLRKLAQIEYDWLANMAERLFLGIFLTIFFLLTGGINVIGLTLNSYELICSLFQKFIENKRNVHQPKFAHFSGEWDDNMQGKLSIFSTWWVVLNGTIAYVGYCKNVAHFL